MTTMNTAADSPWGGRLATPIQMPADWAHDTPNRGFVALSDANISEVFRRAKALQRERERLHPKAPTPSSVGFTDPDCTEPLHSRFFEWALLKLR